jgi:hypothetical protein
VDDALPAPARGRALLGVWAEARARLIHRHEPLAPFVDWSGPRAIRVSFRHAARRLIRVNGRAGWEAHREARTAGVAREWHGRPAFILTVSIKSEC